MIVSYADIDNQGHQGKIYQASNWIYLGLFGGTGQKIFFYKGKWTHNRTINSLAPELRARLKATLPQKRDGRKHKYIYCFDKELKKEWQKKALPYPN